MDEPEQQPTGPRWRWAYAVAWAAAFAAALAADRTVAVHAATGGFDGGVKRSAWAYYLKWPGDFGFTAAVLAVLWVAGQVRWRAAVYVVAVVAASGLNGGVKWVVGRTRPFKLSDGLPEPRPFALHPFWHGGYGFFHQQNLSFPSGHACTAWALAAALAVVWRRGAWAAMVLAFGTGAERVLENAHYASDVVAAVGFSTLLAWGVARVTWGWMHPPAAVRRGFEVVRAADG